MKDRKKWMITICIFLGIAIAFTGAAYGVSMFIKNVAALGTMNYTNECQITEINVLTLDKVKVVVEPTAHTVANRVYTIHLYAGTTDENLTEVTSQTVSWSAPQISAGTPQVIIFTGLNLAPVTKIHVEITH